MLVHRYSKKNVNLVEEMDFKETQLQIKTRPSINRGEERKVFQHSSNERNIPNTKLADSAPCISNAGALCEHNTQCLLQVEHSLNLLITPSSTWQDDLKRVWIHFQVLNLGVTNSDVFYEEHLKQPANEKHLLYQSGQDFQL